MKKFKGFTLIELMIVVAIFSILAAIFIPRFFSSDNACVIHSPSQSYLNVDKSTIEYSESEVFFTSYSGKEVILNRYNADIVCYTSE